MRRRFSLLILLALAFFACSGLGTVALAADPATGAAPTHRPLPLKPDVLFEVGNLAVTNSMVVTWIVAAGIILCAQLATRKIKPVPTGLQNFWEWLVESLYNFLENMIGRDLVKKTFWFFATIFIFILFLNWFGLIPGVGTIGWGHHDAAGAFSYRPAAAPRRQREPEPDLRHGVRLFRLLDRLGGPGERPWRRGQTSLCAERATPPASSRF